MNTQVIPRNKAAFIKINKCTRFPTKVFAAPLCSHQHILNRGVPWASRSCCIGDGAFARGWWGGGGWGWWKGRGGRCTEGNVIGIRRGLHQHSIVVLVARALNCKPHFYVSSSSCLLPRALTLASPLSHHSNCAGPACSAAGYRKAEDEMSGTTSQADPIDATARIVLLNRAQTTKFCDNHVRWVHSGLYWKWYNVVWFIHACFIVFFV